MTVREKEIEKALRVMVERHGGRCLKWTCPGWAGVPDRIVLIPGGRILFAEIKRPKGGKISELQKWWFDTLTGLGFLHWFVWTKEDVRKIEMMIFGGESE